jgi:hypothetical protein
VGVSAFGKAQIDVTQLINVITKVVRMVRLALIGAALTLLTWTAHGQSRTYELVGGALLTDTIQEHTDGQYLPVRPVGSADTLWVWIQGVTRDQGPHRREAQSADLVAWCFPGAYPDPRHVLPSARRVYIATQRFGGRQWIWFFSESTKNRIGLDARNSSL